MRENMRNSAPNYSLVTKVPEAHSFVPKVNAPSQMSAASNSQQLM